MSRHAFVFCAGSFLISFRAFAATPSVPSVHWTEVASSARAALNGHPLGRRDAQLVQLDRILRDVEEGGVESPLFARYLEDPRALVAAGSNEKVKLLLGAVAAAGREVDGQAINILDRGETGSLSAADQERLVALMRDSDYLSLEVLRRVGRRLVQDGVVRAQDLLDKNFDGRILRGSGVEPVEDERDPRLDAQRPQLQHAIQRLRPILEKDFPNAAAAHARIQDATEQLTEEIKEKTSIPAAVRKATGRSLRRMLDTLAPNDQEDIRSYRARTDIIFELLSVGIGVATSAAELERLWAPIPSGRTRRLSLWVASGLTAAATTLLPVAALFAPEIGGFYGAAFPLAGLAGWAAYSHFSRRVEGSHPAARKLLGYVSAFVTAAAGAAVLAQGYPDAGFLLLFVGGFAHQMLGVPMHKTATMGELRSLYWVNWVLVTGFFLGISFQPLLGILFALATGRRTLAAVFRRGIQLRSSDL